MPLVDSPEWIDQLLIDLAIALSTGAFVSWAVLVFPDPGPLVDLPALLGVPPVLWLMLTLFVLSYPVVRWARDHET